MTQENKVYIDTSVYIAILISLTEREKIYKLLQKTTLCSSTILLLETERNLIRLSRENRLTSEQFSTARNQLIEETASFLLKDFTSDLTLTGEFPAILTPRSNDLIHLRTALWFKKNGGLDSFFTLDTKQRASARELGLKTIGL